MDITRRAVVANTTLFNPYLFSPVTIKRSERSDQLAREYYADPYQEWVVFLTNNIIDPYSSWYMNPNEFNDFIVQKYGSITSPQQKVKYYQNNWSYYLGAITRSTYDSLDVSLQKYYEPMFDGYNNIYAYSRIQQDWVINTNHLVSYNFNFNIPQFTLDEIVTVNFDATRSGNAQVVSCSSNTLNLQHVIGYYIPPNPIVPATFSITGTESGSIINIVNTTDVVFNAFNTVSAAEQVYYSPVTYYSYEYNKNEANKNINIMEKSFVPQLSKTLTKVLNN